MAKVKVHCQACNTPIYKFPTHAKRTKYHFCSDECKGLYCIPVKCSVCKNTFMSTARGYTTAKYCSDECHNAQLRKKWKSDKGNQVKKKCVQCGKSFSIRSSLKDKQEFCSLKCFHDSGRIVRSGEDNSKWKPKISVTCEHCGKTFETYPSRKDRRKYCSKICSVIGNFQRLAQNPRTDIEKKMAKALNRSGFRYKEQVVMFDKFMVDFKLIDYNIIIQCDGLYWHDRDNVKRKDKGQDRYMSKAGYIVLRFSDSQINNDINACIKRIKQTIESGQLPLINY